MQQSDMFRAKIKRLYVNGETRIKKIQQTGEKSAGKSEIKYKQKQKLHR